MTCRTALGAPNTLAHAVSDLGPELHVLSRALIEELHACVVEDSKITTLLRQVVALTPTHLAHTFPSRSGATLDADASTSTVVAIHKGKAVGVAQLVREQVNPKRGRISLIAVHESYRRKGHGTRMFEAILHLAREQELKLLLATVTDYPEMLDWKQCQFFYALDFHVAGKMHPETFLELSL